MQNLNNEVEIIKEDENSEVETVSTPKTNSKAKSIITYILTVGITFSVCCLLMHFVGQFIYVSGESMEPTFSSGDVVFIKKFSNELKRNDVVVSKVNAIGSETKKERIIKRIIGLPGETIQIKRGQVYINGEVLKDDPINTYIMDGAEAEDPIVLKDNEYFLLGDNRNESFDSRYPAVGPAPESNIVGVVIFTLPF